jgi:hypothetical protein
MKVEICPKLPQSDKYCLADNFLNWSLADKNTIKFIKISEILKEN